MKGGINMGKEYYERVNVWLEDRWLLRERVIEEGVVRNRAWKRQDAYRRRRESTRIRMAAARGSI